MHDRSGLGTSVRETGSGDRGFRLLAENLPLMCWLAEPDGRVAWCNRRWTDYTGTMPEDFARDGLRPVIDPAVYPEALSRWKAVIADALLQATGCRLLYERSDSSLRKLEGLEPVRGWLRRPDGAEPPTEVLIREHGWQLAVDVAAGHKTGYYLDQRDLLENASEPGPARS